MTNTTYLLVDSALQSGSVIEDDRLTGLTERHKLELVVPIGEPIADPVQRVARDALAGLILCSDSGLVGRAGLTLLRQAIAQGVKVYVYWPQEQALEVAGLDGGRRAETLSAEEFLNLAALWKRASLV